MMEVLNGLATRAQPELHPLLQERGGGPHPAGGRDGRQGSVRRLQRNIIRTAVRFSSPSPTTRAR